MSASHALTTIARRRIKVGQPLTLNDPFDCFPAIAVTPELGETVDHWERFLEDWSSRFGVVCYTQDPENHLLWSHYADKHRGVALQFDWPDDQRPYEVHYTLRRPVVTDAKLLMLSTSDAISYGLPLISQAFAAKSPAWKYEAEYRTFHLISECSTENGFYFHDYPMNFLTGVILGGKCNEDEGTFLGALSEGRYEDSCVRRATLSRTEFEMSI